MSEPRLGLATTRELLAELVARFYVARTVGEAWTVATRDAHDGEKWCEALLERLPAAALDYRTVSDE